MTVNINLTWLKLQGKEVEDVCYKISNSLFFNNTNCFYYFFFFYTRLQT